MANTNFQAFAKEFANYFGYTPQYLKYMLTQIDERVSKLEKDWQEALPVLGATIVKTESIVETLNRHVKFGNGISYKSLVLSEVESYMSNNGMNNRRLK